MEGQITRRMELVEQSIQSLFNNFYCKTDFLSLLYEARDANTDRRPFVLRKLAQKLNSIGIKCESNKSFAYYKKIVLALDIPDNTNAINKKLVEALRDIYDSYPRPDEFMSRIVNLLDSDTNAQGSLRLRILRRFMVTVNVKENKKYYSKTLAKKDIFDIDESIFEELTDDRKSKNDYIPLVQAASNLAEGNFISPVTTKELLFLFAFAYDMRYYASVDDENYVVRKDVEKHLFEDYYCDNLTRYIYLEDGGKSGNSDKEPSGMGLNPKNFIDVIFIYYLNKEGLDASQKVSGFYNMANRIKDIWKDNFEYGEQKKSSFENALTKEYMDKINTVINGMDEAAFENYILKNYYCDVRYTYVNKKSGETQVGYKGLFELQFAINSVYNQYREILDLIKEILHLPEHADFSKINRKLVKELGEDESAYSIYLNESKFELEKNVPSTNLKYFKDSAENQDDFLLIIKSIEKRLSLDEALAVSEATDVTRTKLIAAYYHYYCLENVGEALSGKWRSFKDVYDDMSTCLNVYLESAGFQTVNVKNLYDVFVIFFAYCKVNNFLN